jgi:hypothetical protein
VVQLKSSVHNLRLDLGEVFPPVARVRVKICVREWPNPSNKGQMLLVMVRQKI